MSQYDQTGPKPVATGIRGNISNFFRIIDSTIFEILTDTTQIYTKSKQDTTSKDWEH
jgi:hypothetical protein